METDYGMTALGYCALMIISWALGYYSFSVVWTWFLVAFIALTARLWRKREKRIQALQYAALREKEAVTAYLKDLPEWVHFSEEEKVEWINKLVCQVWPFVTAFATDYFKQTLEPAIRASMPSAFSKIRIDQLHFGQTPFRVEAIRVFKSEETRDERLTMDMEIAYDGDCECIISINFMKAGARRMKLKGKVRVIVGPLVSRQPFVEAVTVFFLTQPLIDFDLTGIGEILEIPALLNTLKTVMNKQVNDLCVLPNRIVVPLSAEVDSSRLYTQELDGAIRVYILEARNLQNRDSSFGGKSDAYVKASVGALKYRTKTIDNDLNPAWNELFQAVVHQVTAQQLRLEMYDEDPGSDEFLGEITIDLTSIKEKGLLDQWFPLENAKSGDIHLSLLWFDLATDSRGDQAQEPPLEVAERPDVLPSSHLLMVYVDKAYLPSETTPNQSPFIELIIDEDRFKTYAKAATAEPLYHETFYFFISQVEERMLRVEAKDSNASDEKIGWIDIPVSSLLQENGEKVQTKFPLGDENSDGTSGNEERQPFVILTLKLRRLQSTHDGEEMERISSLHLHPKQKNENESLTGDSKDPLGGSMASLISAGPVKRQAANRRKIFSKQREDCGKIQASIAYNSRWNTLAVTVHQINGLIPANEEYNADPFVVINARKGKGKISTKQSSVNYDSLNPLFDETFEFKVSENELREYTIVLEVKDAIKYKLLSKKPTLGKVSIGLSAFSINQPVIKKWFDLQSATD